MRQLRKVGFIEAGACRTVPTPQRLGAGPQAQDLEDRPVAWLSALGLLLGKQPPAMPSGRVLVRWP